MTAEKRFFFHRSQSSLSGHKAGIVDLCERLSGGSRRGPGKPILERFPRSLPESPQMKGVVVAAALILAVMVAIKDGRLFHHAGLSGGCTAVATPSGQTGAWQKC